MILQNTLWVAKFGQIPVISEFVLFFTAHIPFQWILLTCSLDIYGDFRGLMPFLKKKTMSKLSKTTLCDGQWALPTFVLIGNKLQCDQMHTSTMMNTFCKSAIVYSSTTISWVYMLCQGILYNDTRFLLIPGAGFNAKAWKMNAERGLFFNAQFLIYLFAMLFTVRVLQYSNHCLFSCMNVLRFISRFKKFQALMESNWPLHLTAN